MSTTTDTPTVIIHIPTPLRAYTDDQATTPVSGATAGEALRALVARYPELETHLDEEDTPLSEGDELSIVPSIAGG